MASIYAVNEGHFDKVPTEKIKAAQAALLTRLSKDHAKEMEALNKGEEKIDSGSPSAKIIAKAADTAAKGFEG